MKKFAALAFLFTASPAFSQSRVLPELKIDFSLIGFNQEQIATTNHWKLRRNLDPSLPIEEKEQREATHWEAQRSGDIAALSEGTGTRGGGSGVASAIGTETRVELLDLFRSEGTNRSPLFFQVDPRLIDLGKGLDDEAASEKILTEVIRRLGVTLPSLSRAIQKARDELNNNFWVRTSVELPLIHDFLGELKLDPHQRQVQIAYRIHNKVIFNARYYSAMDAINRAALKLHEFTYALSSGKDSLAIQRFVSLAFSPEVDSSSFVAKAREYLAQMDLLALSWESLQLPEGVHVGPRPQLRSMLCGTLAKMELIPGTKSVSVAVAYDPKRPKFSARDFDLSDANKIQRYLANPPQFTRVEKLTLEGQDLAKFLQTLYRVKFTSRKNFPLYLYPASSVRADILCVNSKTHRLVSLETGLSYNPNENARELERAQTEADYYASLESYTALKSKIENASESSMGEENLERLLKQMSSFRDLENRLIELSPTRASPFSKISGERTLDESVVVFD